jgi:hypothetical protein
MATTLSDGTTTLNPTIVDGWESAQASRNVIHDILGNTSPDVTLRAPRMRTGTLKTVWLTKAQAEAARQLHLTANVFTLTSTEITYITMQYVVAGNITTTLYDDTRNAWTVNIDFQEVIA